MARASVFPTSAYGAYSTATELHGLQLACFNNDPKQRRGRNNNLHSHANRRYHTPLNSPAGDSSIPANLQWESAQRQNRFHVFH